VRALAPGTEDDTAVDWLERAVTGELEALVPELVFAEVANALLVQVRAGAFRLADAEAAVRLLAALPVRSVGLRELAAEALVVSAQAGLSVYDGCYLALAEATRAVLVTADRRLAEASSKGALRPRSR
jgi:predicted nucleic acid-binding protein